MSFDDSTIRFYRENAAAYVQRPQRSFVRLQTFLGELPRGAKILELGCGSGRHSAEMIAGGFDVHPTDGSPEMAAEAARRLGRPVETLRFDELDEREEYDAVWASACLLHVPKAHLQGVLARIWRALKAGRTVLRQLQGRQGRRPRYDRPLLQLSVRGLAQAVLSQCRQLDLSLNRSQRRQRLRRHRRNDDASCGAEGRGLTPSRHTHLKIASTSTTWATKPTVNASVRNTGSPSV